MTTSTTAFGGAGTTCGGAGANGLCVSAAGANDLDGALQFFVFPRITSISPSGAGEGQEGAAVTITGTRFDSGAATGTVAFANCNTSNVLATLTSWSDTSIALTVPLGISDNDDLCDVNVVRAAGTGSKSATSTNFTVLPDITGIATQLGGRLARKYGQGVTLDGLVYTTGKHFGGSGTATILGVAAVTNAAAEGPCGVGGYASTTICWRVPDVASSTYSGSIVVTRTADSKQDTETDLRIAPRVTSTSPTSGVVGDTVQILGDHLCATSAGTGTCPPAAPFTVSSSLYVKFGSTTSTASDFVNKRPSCAGADAGNSWDNTGICVKVPVGASIGGVAIETRANGTLSSNTNVIFTVQSTVPNDPTNLEQFKTDDTLLSTGATTTELAIKLEADLSATLSISMILEFEVKAIGTAFDAAVATSTNVQTGTSFPNSEAIYRSVADGTSYHWRVRAKNTGTGETSNWVAYGANPTGDGTTDGTPANTDFSVDVSGPVITGTAASNITDLVADITWTTNESADRQVGYSSSTCPTASGQTGFDSFPRKEPASPTGSGTSHTVSLQNLLAGTTYQYRVRSADTLSNVSFDPGDTTCRTFVTSSAVTRIMRSVAYSSAMFAPITGTTATTSLFKVFLAETNATATSAHIEVSGVNIGDGATNPTIAVAMNGQATSTYALPNSSSPIPFTVRYKLPSLTFSCTAPAVDQNAICKDGVSDNRLSLKFGGGFTKATLVRGRFNMTYYYTP